MTKLNIHNEQSYAVAMQHLSGIDPLKGWTLELKRKTKHRSNNQNALYWKWMTIVGQEIGYSKDEMDLVFKDKFLAPKIVTVGDEEHKLYSTSGMDTKGMTGYLKLIDMFCARDLGIVLPHPEDQHYESR